MAKILSIIAPEGYQDIEYNDSKEALEEAGHTVETASTTQEAQGKLGGTVTPDILIQDVFPEKYDAVVFIGGPGVYRFFDDPTVQKIAKDFLQQNKPTAAICAAPAILAKAGLLKGKKATCFTGVSDILKENAADYTGNPVEQDGLIITADGPDSAKEFGEKVAEAIQR